MIICNLYLLIIQICICAKIIIYSTDKQINIFPLKILFVCMYIVFVLVYEQKKQKLNYGEFLIITGVLISDLFIVQKWCGAFNSTIVINTVFILLIWIPFIYVKTSTKGVDELYHPYEVFSIYFISYVMYFVLLLYLYFEETNIISIIVAVVTSVIIDLLRLISVLFHNKSQKPISSRTVLNGAIFQLIVSIMVLVILPYNELNGNVKNENVTIYILRLLLMCVALILAVCINPTNKVFKALQKEYNDSLN